MNLIWVFRSANFSKAGNKFGIYIIAGFAILSLALYSCDSRDIVFEKSIELKNSQWTYADSLLYTFPVKDTSKIYNILLDISHAKSYAFQNIYLKIHTRFPSGKRIQNQINIDLAEPSGKWNSDCGRNTCELEIPIQQGAYFNEPGDYTITIEQYLRKDTLTGIEAVRVSLEDTGKVRGK